MVMAEGLQLPASASMKWGPQDTSGALEDVLGKLFVHGECCHGRMQDLAELGIREDLAPVTGVLKALLPDVCPDHLHNLHPSMQSG